MTARFSNGETVEDRVTSPGLGSGPIVIVPYDSAWPALFRAVADPIRLALGDVAVRIDHIGSTAVPELAAKPVIDVQVSVREFEPLAPFRDPLVALGYVFRGDNPERTKRYFREAPGTRRTHIHVRRAGSWNEQFALLFRDFLRAHPDVAGDYAELKTGLAHEHSLSGLNRHAYVEAKQPFIWATMARADEWAQVTGWEPGASDA